jgi:hypothetical protein
MPRIMQVDSVVVQVLKSSPPQILVEASGQTNTSGWKHFELQPYVYIQPPRDGIWDMDFAGQAPTGIVLPVLRPAHASVTLPLPDWCKGVRVHAASNAMEAILSGTPATNFVAV